MIDYYIYWLLFPHCKESKKVIQTDGKIGYVCKHMNFGENK